MPPSRHLPHLGRIKLGKDSIDLDDYLKGDYANIEDAAAELPAVIEWVNARTQEFVEVYHNLKHEVEEAEASAYFSMYDGGTESFAALHPGVKPTAVAIQHAVALDPEVRSKKISLANARGWMERLRQLQVNLASKSDLTRSSEATRRRIIQDEPPDVD